MVSGTYSSLTTVTVTRLTPCFSFSIHSEPLPQNRIKMSDKQDSKYWMESQVERKRLASNHYIAKDEMKDKLVLAPVDFSQPLKILDSGTADGKSRIPDASHYS